MLLVDGYSGWLAILAPDLDADAPLPREMKPSRLATARSIDAMRLLLGTHTVTTPGTPPQTVCERVSSAAALAFRMRSAWRLKRVDPVLPWGSSVVVGVGAGER